MVIYKIPQAILAKLHPQAILAKKMLKTAAAYQTLENGHTSFVGNFEKWT